MNEGNIGPIRFITSVEIPKHQLNQNIPDNSVKLSKVHDLSKTFIIAGGEGYEDYNSSNSSNLCGSSNTNVNNAMNLNTSSNNATIEMTNNTANLNTYTPNCNLTLQNNLAYMSSNNSDDNKVGKDDLTNNILIWEV